MSGEAHDPPHAATDVPTPVPGLASIVRAESSARAGPANVRAALSAEAPASDSAFGRNAAPEPTAPAAFVTVPDSEPRPSDPEAPVVLGEEGERSARAVRVVRWDGASDALYRAPERIPVLWYAIEPGSGLAGDDERELSPVTFPATSLALLPPAKPFRFRPDGPGAGAFVECDVGLDDAVGRGATDPDRPLPYRFVRDAVALDTARLIVTLCAAEPDGRSAALLADLARACVERVAERLSETPGRPPGPGGLDAARLARVTRFVEAGLDGPLRLVDLAAVACLSTSQFCRAFKASTGTSPLRYVRARRLARARALLVDAPDVAIAEVAARCGFVAQSHLTRLMRDEFGVTPAALRRRVGTVNAARGTGAASAAGCGPEG